jgi:hypothetical protein
MPTLIKQPSAGGIPRKQPWLGHRKRKTDMSMIFEFKAMKQAKAFVAAVKKRFHLDGQTFDDADAAQEHDFFPFVQIPPVAHIERVDGDVAEVQKRLLRCHADRLAIHDSVLKRERAARDELANKLAKIRGDNV